MKQTMRIPQPATRRLEDTPPTPDLYVEPEDGLLILGEMLYDVSTMGEKLRELPFSRTAFRGNLRVVRGAAVRIADRCAQLLGEALAPTRTESSESTRTNADTRTPEPSNKIDSPQLGDRTDPPLNPELAGDGADPELLAEDVQPPAESDPVRNRPGSSPNGLGKRPFTTAETFILSELAEQQHLTSNQILKALVVKYSIPSDQTNDALAALRKDGYVITNRVGRGYINELAAGLSS